MSGDLGGGAGVRPVMAAGVGLRAAGPGGAAGLLALKRALGHQTRFVLLEPGERAEGPGGVAAGLDQVARGDNSVVLVAGSGGRLAGHAGARGGRFRRNRGTAYVVTGVLAGARGQGVGRRLLEELKRWAPAQGIHRLELTVMAGSQRARDLYQRMGFTAEGRRRECLAVDGRLAGALSMALLLPAPTS